MASAIHSVSRTVGSREGKASQSSQLLPVSISNQTSCICFNLLPSQAGTTLRGADWSTCCRGTLARSSKNGNNRCDWTNRTAQARRLASSAPPEQGLRRRFFRASSGPVLRSSHASVGFLRGGSALRRAKGPMSSGGKWGSQLSRAWRG